MIEVSIITVGMNHLRFIKELYRTLFSEHPPRVSVEAIYVDNCSQDGSIDWLEANYPNVRIIRNDKVMGFGENNNIGVRASSGKYVAIINPDIEFMDDAIDRLYQYAENNRDSFGILAPKLLSPDGSIQYSARNFITLRSFFYRALTRGNDKSENQSVGSYLRKDLDLDKVQPVNWVMGAAMFMSREFYDMLGGFDTDYFLYMEDEDLCMRSWKVGKPVVYCGNISVIHNHRRGSRKIGKLMFIHFCSLFTFFRKHGLNIKDQTVK